MNRLKRLVTVGLFGVALAAAACGGGSSATSTSAKPSRGFTQSKVGYSQGISIENHSNHQIKLINITGDGNFEGRPADGTVLKPGDSTRVEVQFRAFHREQDYANFQILGDGGKSIGTFTANMAVNAVNQPAAFCATTVGSCTPVATCNPCDPDSSPWNEPWDQRTIVLQ
jgi:hypothetical protein